jgi:hypothetical protein
VWVTYNDDASEDDVSALREEVEGDPYRLMSPNPEQDSPVVLTAWGRTLALDSADDGRVGEFLGAYTNGRQTPEKGAVCSASRPPVRCRARRPSPRRPDQRLPSRAPPPSSRGPAYSAGGRPARRRTTSMSSSGSNGLVR